MPGTSQQVDPVNAPDSVNVPGVPQYPKGHAGRLLVTLAAIATLPRPTAHTVAKLTGFSKSHTDQYVRKLNAELGTVIDKDGPVYRLVSWGPTLKRAGVLAYLKASASTSSSSPTPAIRKHKER